MELKELKQHLDSAHSEMKGLIDKQSDEIKNIGKVSDETAAQIKAAEKRVDEVNQEMGERLDQVEKRLGRPGEAGAAEQRKSIGDLFVESDQYKSAVNRGDTRTDAFEAKDITSGAASVGQVVPEHQIQQIFRDPADRPRFIRDLLNVSETNSNSIEFYVDRLGFDNQAGAQNGELTLKNKSDLTLEEKTAAVKTIAHHVIASRQVMEDAPMLSSYINGRLAYGLKLEEDRQILYGDGTGGTITGIFNTTGVQDHGDRPASDDYVTHIRKAMTKARLAEYPVNGLIINPQDWENIELLQSTDGHYIWLWYMSSQDTPRVFRMPVIETTAVNQGDFLLGNWDMAATLWDRRQASIRLSDSHQDLFVKNGLAILGEERVALTVQRPQAFVKGSFVEAV